MGNQAQITTSGDTLAVAGRVDFSNVVQLYEQGDTWLQVSAPGDCRLDFGGITQCNSAATTLLLSWLRSGSRCGKNISVANIPATMESLMDLGGLLKVVSVQR